MNLTYALYASIAVIVAGTLFIAWDRKWLHAAWHLIFPEPLEGTPCSVLAKAGMPCRILPGRVVMPQHAVVKTTDEPIHLNSGTVKYQWIDGTDQAFDADLDHPLGTDENNNPIYAHNVGSVFAAGVRPEFINSQFYATALELKPAQDIKLQLQDLREKTNIPWMKYLLWAGIVIGVIFLWKSGIISQVLKDTIPQTAPVTTPATPPGPNIVIPRNND